MKKNKLSVLQNVKKSDVQNDPFPLVVAKDALNQTVYEELYKSYPTDRLIVENDYNNAVAFENAEQNTRYQISAKQIHEGKLLLPTIWQEFVEYHTSQEFLNEVLDLFGESIVHHYPNMSHKVLNKDYRAGVRRYSDAPEECDLALDCQPGINTPLTSISKVLGPHLDNSVELYAGLLYFKDPQDKSFGGDLVVNGWTIPSPKFYGKSRVQANHVEEIQRVSYAPNTLVMFVNTINSVHEVTMREPTTYSRKLVNIIGEVYPVMPNGLFSPIKKRPSLNPFKLARMFNKS